MLGDGLVTTQLNLLPRCCVLDLEQHNATVEQKE